MSRKRIASNLPLRAGMDRRSLLASSLLGGAWAALPASAARCTSIALTRTPAGGTAMSTAVPKS